MAKVFPRRDSKGRIKENIYMTVFYPDAQNYDFEENLIWIKNNAIQYCIAKHFKDINEHGEYINKPHAHIYFQFANPRVLDCIKEALKLGNDAEIKAVNLKKIGGNPSGIIRYYAHVTKEAKEHNKIEYDYHEFDTNMDIEPFFVQSEVVTPDQKVSLIREYIKNKQCVISYDELIGWALDNNCFSELRRGNWLFRGLLYEHNEKYKRHISISYKKTRGKVIRGSVFRRDDNLKF